MAPGRGQYALFHHLASPTHDLRLQRGLRAYYVWRRLSVSAREQITALTLMPDWSVHRPSNGSSDIYIEERPIAYTAHQNMQTPGEELNWGTSWPAVDNPAPGGAVVGCNTHEK